MHKLAVGGDEEDGWRRSKGKVGGAENASGHESYYALHTKRPQFERGGDAMSTSEN